MRRHNQRFVRFTGVRGFLLAVLAIAPVRADILSVTQNVSSAGQAAAIIPPPTDLTNQCVTNEAQQGFNEKQQVTTAATYATDQGSIPAGTTFVNSHMIFLNQATANTGNLNHTDVTWTFDFPIIGVMSDQNGTREAASTPEFGATATNYASFPTRCGTSSLTGDKVAPFTDRGLEPLEGYTVAGSTLNISMHVSQPGDWIRVLTRGENVQVDIKPGGYPNCMNINGNGVIPVAILGSSTLNVSTIDTSSLSFNGLAVRVKGNNQNQCSQQDVNSDGIADLVCQFQDSTANWVQGSAVGVVSGWLTNGTPIRGTDSICIVP